MRFANIGWQQTKKKNQTDFERTKKMKNGTCPKCGSTEVYDDTSKGRLARGYRDGLAIDGFSSIPLINYVCTDCGYTENYVQHKEDTERLKRKWNRTVKRKNNEV